MSDKANNGRRRRAASSHTGPPKRVSPGGGRPASEPVEQVVEPRRQQYLVTHRVGLQLLGQQPIDFDAVKRQLNEDPDIEVEPRTLRVQSDVFRALGVGPPAGLVGGMGGQPPPQEQQEVLIARMPQARAEELSANAQLLVEVDHPLSYSQPVEPAAELIVRDPGVLVPLGAELTLRLRVLGRDNAPVPGASVYVYGSSFPAQATTDEQGEATVAMRGELPHTLRGLYVNPTRGHWSLWIADPELQAEQVNVVQLRPLDTFFPDFPKRMVIGWGQRAMRLDRLRPDLRGQGARVAVVDSGAATTTHQDLAQIRVGLDLTTSNDQTWKQDTIGHGSHCSGVIAGIDNARGVRGFAPAAEVHEIKLFPGGGFSSLLDALDYCIRNQIDIVNLSLGSDQRSELIEQKILEAKRHGVACIVAAGDAGGPVQFPGALADVLTVAAIGRYGEFPPDSYHGVQAWTDGKAVSGDGYFSAKFTCFGREVDVCAPGVAIVSTVPPDGYAAWDGTSMATPHVTGLAALVLAHHPDFRGPFQARNEARVERLFQVLKESAQPLDFGDTSRTGVGLPDAPRSLGLEPSLPRPGPQASDPALVLVWALLQDLRAAMQQVGLLPAGPGTPGAVSWAATSAGIGPQSPAAQPTPPVGFAPASGVGFPTGPVPSGFGPAGLPAGGTASPASTAGEPIGTHRSQDAATPPSQAPEAAAVANAMGELRAIMEGARLLTDGNGRPSNPPTTGA
jgi:subtilisin